MLQTKLFALRSTRLAAEAARFLHHALNALRALIDCLQAYYLIVQFGKPCSGNLCHLSNPSDLAVAFVIVRSDAFDFAINGTLVPMN